MKVIFLDFDGVLNSDAWFKSQPNRLFSADEHWQANAFDRAAVRRLNAIIANTGAKVVISSSWKSAYDLAKLVEILAAHGFEGQVIDMTPDIGGRGREIRAWLDACGLCLTSYVAIDDSGQETMAPIERCVETTWAFGLLDKHVERAIRLLETPLEAP